MNITIILSLLILTNNYYFGIIFLLIQYVGIVQPRTEYCINKGVLFGSADTLQTVRFYYEVIKWKKKRKISVKECLII